MRIGINGCSFNQHPSGAVQRFAGLYREVFRDSTNEYVVFEPRDASLRTYFDPSVRATFVRTPLPSDRSAERALVGEVYWRRALRKERIEVVDDGSSSRPPRP